jgi:hypothetical protein
MVFPHESGVNSRQWYPDNLCRYLHRDHRPYRSLQVRHSTRSKIDRTVFLLIDSLGVFFVVEFGFLVEVLGFVGEGMVLYCVCYDCYFEVQIDKMLFFMVCLCLAIF